MMAGDPPILAISRGKKQLPPPCGQANQVDRWWVEGVRVCRFGWIGGLEKLISIYTYRYVYAQIQLYAHVHIHIFIYAHKNIYTNILYASRKPTSPNVDSWGFGFGLGSWGFGLESGGLLGVRVGLLGYIKYMSYSYWTRQLVLHECSKHEHRHATETMENTMHYN